MGINKIFCLYIWVCLYPEKASKGFAWSYKRKKLSSSHLTRGDPAVLGVNTRPGSMEKNSINHKERA